MIDFPIKAPANAKALPEVLPALMPNLAKAQDDLGTVRFSRFMVKGDEKLLFLFSDIDGEVDQHIERLADSAGPVFDAIFEHVDDPPATPVAGNPQGVIKWLKHHIHEPLATYFAYEDASVQDVKACRECGGLYGHYLAGPLADPHDHPVTSASVCPETAREAHVQEEVNEASDFCWTLHGAHFVPFEDHHLGFFTAYDGDFKKYIQDFAEKNSLVFDAVFPPVVGAPPTPVGKNAQAFYQWALQNNYPTIGFYSAYPGLVFYIRALLADRKSQPATD